MAALISADIIEYNIHICHDEYIHCKWRLSANIIILDLYVGHSEEMHTEHLDTASIW